MKNVCLYFGSFNPLHIGHLAIANYLAIREGIDEVWFVLSPLNPWKDLSEQLPFERRAEVIRQATAGDSRFRLSTIENLLPRPHYTISSIRALEIAHPDVRFCLLIGADNWLKLDHWHEYKRLFEHVTCYIYPRRGCDVDPDQYEYEAIYLSDAPLIEISSTDIRRAARCDIDLRYWLAEPNDWEQLKRELNSLQNQSR